MPDRRVFRFGKFEVDCLSCELRKNGIRLKLDEQPFRLLCELLARNGALASRDELRQALWPDGTYVDFDRSLTRAVNKLRLALSDDAANPRFIETVPRRGYRFIAPVTMTANSEEEKVPVTPEVENGSAAELSGAASEGEGRQRWRLRTVCALACAGLAIAGVAWYFFRRPSPVTASALVLDEGTQALYAKGRFLAAEGNRDAIERGIRILDKVIEKAPEYGPAYAALAEGWFGLASVYLSPMETMPKARTAARKAISLDPASVDGHAVLGRVHVFYDWDWAGAEEQFQRALALNASSANALKGRACLRMMQGRSADAVRDIDAALKIDPRSLWLHFMAVAFRANARQYDSALRQARSSLEWEPRFGMLRSFAAVISALNGNRSDALTELELGVQQQRVPTSIGFMALGNGLAGRKTQAEQALGELMELAKKRYVCPFEVACAYASLGRNDEAFAWLEKSIAERADCIIWLRAEPWLDSIRKDPRYGEVLRQVSFP